MTETPLNISLRDPVSDVTRKERKALLAVSVLSIFIVKTGLVPSKISALGIDFEKADQMEFRFVMAFVVLYFLVAFLLYGLTDFLAWRISYNEGAKNTYREFFEQMHVPKKDGGPYPKEWISKWPNYLAFPASYARALFEFILPLVIGCYAIYCLVCITK